jgi:hypothetical protein
MHARFWKNTRRLLWHRAFEFQATLLWEDSDNWGDYVAVATVDISVLVTVTNMENGSSLGPVIQGGGCRLEG